jgi:hypothetical protein
MEGNPFTNSLLFANVEATMRLLRLCVNQTTLWQGGESNSAIANSLRYFQFANNNERFQPLIVVLYLLPYTIGQCMASAMSELFLWVPCTTSA